MLNNELLLQSIKTLCAKKNIKLTNLEKELGFGAGIISRWGNNADPSLSKIVDIADYFHVPLDEVIGRNINIADDFLNLLIEQTEKKKLKWKTLAERHSSNKSISMFDLLIKTYDKGKFEPYDDDNYSQSTYIIDFNIGYISVYAFYKNNHITLPKELKLFIQADCDSDLNEQDYTHDELLRLWLKILNNLDNVPNEVKVENLKKDFINKYMKKEEKRLSPLEIIEIVHNREIMKESLPPIKDE